MKGWIHDLESLVFALCSQDPNLGAAPEELSHMSAGNEDDEFWMLHVRTRPTNPFVVYRTVMEQHHHPLHRSPRTEEP